MAESLRYPKPVPRRAERSRKRNDRTRKGKRTSRRRKARVSQSRVADNLARQACHERGICEAAGWHDTPCAGPLQWAHIMSRQYKRNNLRWRMDNCLCLCAGHHFRWSQKNEAEWRAFLYEHIGLEKVLSLEWEALHGDKPDIPRAIAALAVRAAGTAGRTGCTVACGTDGGYVLPASEADPVREGWGDDE